MRKVGSSDISIGHKRQLNCVILCLSLTLIANSSIFSQEGRLILVKDQDTLSYIGQEVKFFWEIHNNLFPIGTNDQILFPASTATDSINSIVVVYKKDTLSFFNLAMKLRQSTQSESLIRLLQPNYHDLISGRSNMVLYIDTFPFDNDENEMVAMDNSKAFGIVISKVIVLALEYQVLEIQAILRSDSSK